VVAVVHRPANPEGKARFLNNALRHGERSAEAMAQSRECRVLFALREEASEAPAVQIETGRWPPAAV
jgi:hypothetical protein